MFEQLAELSIYASLVTTLFVTFFAWWLSPLTKKYTYMGRELKVSLNYQNKWPGLIMVTFTCPQCFSFALITKKTTFGVRCLHSKWKWIFQRYSGLHGDTNHISVLWRHLLPFLWAVILLQCCAFVTSLLQVLQKFPQLCKPMAVFFTLRTHTR